MHNLSNIHTPVQYCTDVAQREKLRRKELGLTQPQLASKAGVSLGSLRRFEQTGEISLHSLARLALTLGYEEDFESLFQRKAFRSIQEVIDAQDK